MSRSPNCFTFDIPQLAADAGCPHARHSTLPLGASCRRWNLGGAPVSGSPSAAAGRDRPRADSGAPRSQYCGSWPGPDAEQQHGGRRYGMLGCLARASVGLPGRCLANGHWQRLGCRDSGHRWRGRHYDRRSRRRGMPGRAARCGVELPRGRMDDARGGAARESRRSRLISHERTRLVARGQCKRRGMSRDASQSRLEVRARCVDAAGLSFHCAGSRWRVRARWHAQVTCRLLPRISGPS